MDNSVFTRKIISWYRSSDRDLPWRKTSDPYKIWLSEVILQQTRVSQGMPYYLNFIHAFPDVFVLANADEEQVLRLWQGLGYYSRARNLHKCAKVICENYNGVIPPSYQDLLNLPGVGPYTAAAIASLAFNLPFAVMDGNVQRVITRYIGIKENIAEAKTLKMIQEVASGLLDKNFPGDFNQAIMDLGATICISGKPKCGECPVSESCYANHNNLQSSLPFKKKKIKRRKRYFYYWVIRHKDQLILKKRGSNDIWNGLYEFLLTESPTKESWDTMMDPLLKSSLVNHPRIEQVFEYGKHVLSHQDIYSFYIVLDVNEEELKRLKLNYSYQFYSHEQILQLPKPILIDKFLREKII